MKNEAFAPTPELLAKMDAWWRAANYLSACQLYLLDDPLLRRRLTERDIKKKIVGHWGTVPGQNFIYTHLNRVINEYDLDMIYLSGPGHGGNAMVAQDYLDGSYTDVYPNITRDEAGMQRLFKQFSFPGGIPSHVAPETPGSIHEGGELGYSLAHAFGAVMDNPDLIAACVVGDGEAETGPLATAWHGNKFVNPITDGAVLPILHLNGFKIANPTLFSRISHEELEMFFRGCGWEPRFVEGDDPAEMHAKMAETMDWAIEEIHAIQQHARTAHDTTRPYWPMIVFRAPKGWTGPKEVDGKQVEGSFRAHQVPIAMDNPEHLVQLEEWLRSYHPEELFDDNGTLIPELQALAPKGQRRMGANPHANGGLLLRELRMPDFRTYEQPVPAPGAVEAQDMTVLGAFVRDIMRENMDARNFRIFAPDETASNRLSPVFEVTGRRWVAEATDNDEFLDPDGRVMDSMLSEHMCEGWLEGSCSPAATAFSTATRPSSASSIPWSRSTPSGSRSATSCPGGRTLPRSTTCSPRTCGSRTTTASRTRTPASSTTWRIRRPTSCASICRRTQTACSAALTTASAAGTISTSSWPPSTRGRSG